MSTDGGAVWTQIDSMWYNDGGCVIGHPDSAGVVISGGQETDGNFGVSVSRDTGRTWTRVALSSGGADFCYSLALAPSAARTVYAAGQAGGTGAVYRSTDLGSTWARTAGSPPDTVFGLAVSPADAGRVLAATPGGLFRTTDAGATWTSAGAGDGFRSVRFQSADTAAAGGDPGVVFSTDGGATWENVSAGLDGTRVTCLAFVDRGAEVLIAGTRGASCLLWDGATGVDERPTHDVSRFTSAATVVRGVLYLPSPYPLPAGEGTGVRERGVLLDAAGRRVLVLHAGSNDVRGLVPGVYFVRDEGRGARGQGSAKMRKVILQR